MRTYKRLPKFRLYFQSLVALMLLSGCAGGIDAASLAMRLTASEERPLVLDVRTSGEYASGHVPGALNLPVQTLVFNLDRVEAAAPSGPVVVYCAHGPRAGLAGFILRLSGYDEVLHLEGDINGWRRSGLALATGVNPGISGE